MSFNFKYSPEYVVSKIGDSHDMATDKTPTHKRISRAEAGRDEWKMKAIERREENEQLKSQVTNLEKENKEIENMLETANKTIIEQEKLIKNLKKNENVRRLRIFLPWETGLLRISCIRKSKLSQIILVPYTL